MKKTFLFLAALAMSAMTWAETASVELCTSWDKTLAYTTNYTQNYTIDDLNGGETTMTLAVKGVFRQKATDASFQMNKKEGYFKNTTALPGKITKIETTWSVAKGPTKCYFATDAEASASDAVVEVSSATSVTYTPDDEQEYYYFNIDVKTGSGSAQMTSCVVYYEPGTPSTVTLDSLVIKGKAEKMEYEVGEAFDPAGLEVWGIYTKTVKHDSTSQITSGITWTIDPETFATVSDNESVTLVASYKELTTADTTITGINVTEPAPLSKYATIYTSNVEFTAEGGTKVTLSQVVVAEGDTVKAIKCGTTSVDGSCVITIPAATKTLHFHAVGWTGKPTTMDVNGTIYNLVADAGISGTGTIYTLVGEPSDYYFSFDPKGATAITFTAKSDHRFVLYGVNAELEEGVVAAPAFTPTDTDFDGSVEVTLTCETEGAEIFYALNEEVTSMNAQQYTEPIKLTTTTTIYAVAKKDGKESAPVNKTYSLIPAYTLAELVAAGAPTADKKKVVLVLENEVITGVDSNRGIYVKSGDQEIEIFCYNLPETAVKGAYVSGRAMGDWFLFGTEDPKKWELQPADWSWATFTKDPTALQQVMQNANIRKAMHNGRMFILKDNKMFDLQGMLVK